MADPKGWQAVPGRITSQSQLREALKPGLEQLQQQEQSGKDHRYQVKEALVNAGLSVATPEISAAAGVISGERRETLARIFFAEQPPSDIILEDRGGG